MTHLSTKKYDHNVGLSCAFRQHRAHSHCRYLHGYALGVKFVFASEELDGTNWVVDFGGLKPLFQILQDNFDHKTIIAEDDPLLSQFKQLEHLGGLELVVMPAAGCEKFAEFIYEVTEQWLLDAGFAPRCHLVSVEVSEHGGNSALYTKRVL